ncbi:hypothetical protein MFLAVUS_003965 [Mucor flavus]|uniref:Maturase K n=1 Tax=Mucor flavus TaxID=439312 RepID=A0ABP9YUK2_9FUNG
MTGFNLYQCVEKVGDFYSVQFMKRFSRLRTFDIYFIDKLDLFLNEYNKGELFLPDRRVSTIVFEIINQFLLQFAEDDIFANIPQKRRKRRTSYHFRMRTSVLSKSRLLRSRNGFTSSQNQCRPRIGVNVSESHNNGHEYSKVC